MEDNTEKRQKIIVFREEKEALTSRLVQTFKKMDIAQQRFYRIREEWINLKKEYETIDRKEKLLFFSLPENKPKIVKKSKEPTKEDLEKAKDLAMAALKNLPPEVRAEVMKNLKS